MLIFHACTTDVFKTLLHLLQLVLVDCFSFLPSPSLSPSSFTTAIDPTKSDEEDQYQIRLSYLLHSFTTIVQTLANLPLSESLLAQQFSNTALSIIHLFGVRKVTMMEDASRQAMLTVIWNGIQQDHAMERANTEQSRERRGVFYLILLKTIW